MHRFSGLINRDLYWNHHVPSLNMNQTTISHLFKHKLCCLRAEERFDELFEHVAKAAEDDKVHPVEPLRYRWRPARYEKGSTSYVPIEASTLSACILFFNHACSTVGHRKVLYRDSEGIMTYKALESVLLNTPSDADTEAMRRYKDIDFIKVLSRMHLLHRESAPT